MIKKTAISLLITLTILFVGTPLLAQEEEVFIQEKEKVQINKNKSYSMEIRFFLEESGRSFGSDNYDTLGYTADIGLGVFFGGGWHDDELLGIIGIKYRPFWNFISPVITSEIYIHTNPAVLISGGIELFPNYGISLKCIFKYNLYSSESYIYAGFGLNW